MNSRKHGLLTCCYNFRVPAKNLTQVIRCHPRRLVETDACAQHVCQGTLRLCKQKLPAAVNAGQNFSGASGQESNKSSSELNEVINYATIGNEWRNSAWKTFGCANSAESSVPCHLCRESEGVNRWARVAAGTLNLLDMVNRSGLLPRERLHRSLQQTSQSRTWKLMWLTVILPSKYSEFNIPQLLHWYMTAGWLVLRPHFDLLMAATLTVMLCHLICICINIGNVHSRFTPSLWFQAYIYLRLVGMALYQ